MALRLLRAYVPSHDHETILKLRGHSAVEFVDVDDRGDTAIIEIIVRQQSGEEIVSILEARYGHYDGFRILLLAVEGTVPKLGEPAEVEAAASGMPPLNVEELYNDVFAHAQLNWTFAISIAIAALVAATGIVRDSTELIVGSMILAPLLGPNMALATATALADAKLGIRALKVTGAGLGISILIGAAMGAIFGVSMDATAVSGRLHVGVLDFIVAGTAGIAAALSYTSGAFGQIVGVMIAVALLPPLVLTGMLLGALEFSEAIVPALVTLINLIGINLAGVVVLVLRNVRPRKGLEQKSARLAVLTSVGVWSAMLIVMIVLVVLTNTYLK